jgi:phosphopantetheinyl transferase
VQDKKLAIYVLSFIGGSIPNRAECRRLVEQTLRGHLPAVKKPKLVFDSYGKPALENFERIAFSYAHSRTQLVIALHSSARAVGIDTESIDRVADLCELKEAAFSPSEIKNLPDSEYVMAWCRKEAAVKRLGKGFRDADPSDFSVKTNHKSYKLYLGDRKIHDGYFFNIVLGDDVIVVCTDKPTEDFSLYRHTLKDIQAKE